MNSNQLRPHYKRITGKERLRLTLEALEREDLGEADYLVNSCPAHTLPDFWKAEDLALMLASRFAMAANRWLGWLEVVDLLLQPIESLVEASADPLLLEDRALFRSELLARSVAARHLKALLESLEEVSASRLGLPVETLLSAHDAKLRSDLERYGALIEEAEEDPELLGRYEAFLSAPWTMVYEEA